MKNRTTYHSVQKTELYYNTLVNDWYQIEMS